MLGQSTVLHLLLPCERSFSITHFTEEETESQKVELNCPRSHRIGQVETESDSSRPYLAQSFTKSFGFSHRQPGLLLTPKLDDGQFFLALNILLAD